MSHLFQSRLILNSVSKRCISSSTKLMNTNFKLKLTDEMVKEQYEKELASPKKPESPKALHTLESSLIMGRVSHERFDKVIKVAVPKHRLNDHLLLYVRENDNVQVYDERSECNPGDWILLRRQKEPIDKDVDHVVERVVYSYGNYVDPFTGRRSLGLYHDDDMEKLEKIKLEV